MIEPLRRVRQALSLQYDAVARFACTQVLQRFVDFRHRERLSDRCDGMPRTELEHIINGRGTSGRRARNRLLAQYQAEGRNLQRIEDGSDIVQTPFGSKRVEESGHV